MYATVNLFLKLIKLKLSKALICDPHQEGFLMLKTKGNLYGKSRK